MIVIFVVFLFKAKDAKQVGNKYRSSDVCSSDLAPAIRRHADNRGLDHIGLLLQFGLEIAWIDIESARDDHVLGAANQFDEPVRIDATDIAHALPDLPRRREIGRASCRERVCQYV